MVNPHSQLSIFLHVAFHTPPSVVIFLFIYPHTIHCSLLLLDMPVVVSSNCDISEFAPNSASELECLLNRLYVMRIQCPILKPEQRWEDLDDNEKDSLRRQYNITGKDSQSRTVYWFVRPSVCHTFFWLLPCSALLLPKSINYPKYSPCPLTRN